MTKSFLAGSAASAVARAAAVAVGCWSAAAVADPGPRTFTMAAGQLVLPGPVTFEPDSDKVAPESAAALAHVQAFLATKSYVTLLRIEVHTDATGDTASNQTMSEKRALSVARALVGAGVDCKRLLPVGFGDTKPVADKSTATGRAANRRVGFALASLRGRAIGGMPVDGGGSVAGDACR